MLSFKSAARAWSRKHRNIISEARKISMLGRPALALLAELAEKANGPIIELGPYIGGSTIALAFGAQPQVVTVEIGGSNPQHDSLPTSDIIADLRRNLERVGLISRVAIIDGHFRDAGVVSEVETALVGSAPGCCSWICCQERSSPSASMRATWTRMPTLSSTITAPSVARDKAALVSPVHRRRDSSRTGSLFTRM